METVTIQGGKVEAVSPEGVRASMCLPKLIERISPRRLDTLECVLPDGVKAIRPCPNGAIVVHQTSPRICDFRWIEGDSPAPFGPEATYRSVRIALPYLVVMAAFVYAPEGGLRLTNGNECFFANRPLRSLTDELLFPALLNCSRFVPQEGRPLSWICTQHLDRRRINRGRDDDRRLERSLGALLAHLLETGFNLSSEMHEGDSWFSATAAAKVDERVESVEAWVAATEEDPLFALEVPWIPTGLSVAEIADRMGELQKGPRRSFSTAGDLARILFQGQARSAGQRKAKVRE
jgi:hypothetical protein